MKHTKIPFDVDEFKKLIKRPNTHIEPLSRENYGNTLHHIKKNGINFDNISKGRAGQIYSAIMYACREVYQSCGENCLDMLTREFYSNVKELKERRFTNKQQSKKHMLRLLPNNWQEDMWNSSKDTWNRDCIAIMTLASPRPIALEKGIKVEFEDNTLILLIPGSKNREAHPELLHLNADMKLLAASRGQESYKIYFDVRENNIANWLACHYEGQVLSYTRSTYRHALDVTQRNSGLGINDKGKIKPKWNITPNTYRHQGRENITASTLEKGLTGDEASLLIAEYMGHRSTHAQSLYGRKHKKSGKLCGLIKTTTSNNVRRTSPSQNKDFLSFLSKIKLKQ